MGSNIRDVVAGFDRFLERRAQAAKQQGECAVKALEIVFSRNGCKPPELLAHGYYKAAKVFVGKFDGGLRRYLFPKLF